MIETQQALVAACGAERLIKARRSLTLVAGRRFHCNVMSSLVTEAFSPAGDATPGLWVADYLADFDGTVGSIVPACFESYARVFHPARLLVDEQSEGAKEKPPTATWLNGQMYLHWPKPVRWAEVAAANGRQMHPLAQWGSIRGSLDYSQSGNQPGIWDSRPEEGSPPLAIAKDMVAVLQHFTQTPTDCWYGVCDVWGSPLYTNLQAASEFHTPIRSWFLLQGALQSALVSPFPDRHGQLCDLWWPDDRAWFVGSDVDLSARSTRPGRAATSPWPDGRIPRSSTWAWTDPIPRA